MKAAMICDPFDEDFYRVWHHFKVFLYYRGPIRLLCAGYEKSHRDMSCLMVLY